MAHKHHISKNIKSTRLIWAISINLLLTIVQVIGGVVSGSLSLIADALHNLSDAVSIIIALIAQKISTKESDKIMTFGYNRAEIIAAFTNLITLVIIGVYLLYEAMMRFNEPQIIEGWLVIIVAVIALIIDVATAFLTYSISKGSVNIKVAFLHNVSDALASLAVIIAGVLILLYQWYFVDTILTILIATYVLYQAYTMLPNVINILMQASPKDIDTQDLLTNMQNIDGINNVHHLHLWQLDEHHNALEAHIVLLELSEMENVKKLLKEYLAQNYSILHSTLEFETHHCEIEHCEL